jgi:hypothetical protein
VSAYVRLPPIADIGGARHSERVDEHPPKSPQDKKALSYAKDRRNTFGENDKASRKAIPARKAGESRKVRRKARQSLDVLDHADEVKAEVVESSLRHDLERVGGWKKSPDAPLANYLELQARRRSWRGLSPKRKSPKADD